MGVAHTWIVGGRGPPSSVSHAVLQFQHYNIIINFSHTFLVSTNKCSEIASLVQIGNISVSSSLRGVQ